LYWDVDQFGATNTLSGSGLGVAGAWGTSAAQWWNGSALIDQVWNNANNDTAVFTGTAGAVTFPNGVTVGGLIFNTTGYTLGAAGNTLTFGANSNVTLNNIAAATFTANIAGSGNLNITGGVFGGVTAGTVTMTGSGASFTGTTSIGNGMTVALSGGTGTALSNTGGLTFNGGSLTVTSTTNTEAALNHVSDSAAITSNGGTLTVTNTAAAVTSSAEAFGAVTHNAGQLSIVSTNALSTGTSTLTIGGLTRSGSGAVAFGIGGISSIGIATNKIAITGQADGTANVILSPAITVGTTAAAQTDYAVYNINAGTTNTLGIQGAGIAATTQSSWTSSTNAYTYNTAETLAATRTINALRYTGGALTTATGAFYLETLGILNGGSGTLTITGTGGIRQSGTAAANLYVTTGSNAISITSPIVDNTGALTLVKSGTGGTLTLSGTNTFTGGIVINAGTLSYTAATAATLGDVNTPIIFNGSGTLTSTGAGTVAATHAITLNNGAIATFSNAAIAVTYAGNMTGTGGVTINNTTAIATTFSGTNSFSGPINIAQGYFTAGSTGATNANNAVLIANVATTGLNLNNNNLTIGSLSGGGSNATVGVQLGSATLTVGGNNESTTYSGLITGTGALTKTGTGVLILSGANTFSGAANLNGGVANITTLANLGAGSTITFGGGGIQFGAILDPSTRTLTFNAGGAIFDTNNYGIVLGAAVGNSGAGGLTKTGAGILVLAAANTYTGATTVSTGILSVQNAQGLGAGSTGVTVASGAALTLQGGLSIASQPLTLNGTGSAAALPGALVNVSGSNTYAGALVLGSNATISSDAGSLNLSSASALTGSGFTLTLGGAASGTLAGALQNGAGGLSKTGAGTWTLSATAGNYSGPTSITGGTLSIVGGALGSTSGTTLGVGTLSLTSGSQSIGNLALASASNNTVTLGSGAALTVGSSLTRGAGGSVLFDLSAGGGAAVSTAATGSGTNNILGYVLVKDSDGVTGMGRVSGGGIVRYDSTTASVLTSTSNNASTDFTTRTNSGTLTWTNGGSLSARSVNSLTLDATGNNAQVTDMGAASNVLSLASGALQYVGSGDATLQGGQIGVANSEVIIHNVGTGTLTLSSLLAGGTGSVTVDGSGTTIVSGASTYSGGTLLNGGTLKLGASTVNTQGTVSNFTNPGPTLASSPLGLGSALTVASGATLDLNGYALTLGAVSGAGNIALGSGGTLTMGGINNAANVGQIGASTTLSGVVSGTGNLTFTGGGTFALTNNSNTFSGQINIVSGSLVITSPGQLGSGTSPVSITGVSNNGVPGGSILVQGGITMNRGMGVMGRGPAGFLSNAGNSFISVGNNTFGGVTSIGPVETRSVFVSGNTLFSSSSTLILPNTGSSNSFMSSGSGNVFFNGVVTGGQTGDKYGMYRSSFSTLAGSVVLTNWNNNFTANLRVDTGFLRLSHGGEAGMDVSNYQLRASGGTFDIRTDVPASFSAVKASSNDGTINFFMAPAVGGSAIGTESWSTAGLPSYGTTGMVTFGNVLMVAAKTIALSGGRSGYGASFTGASGTMGGSGGDNVTYTNNSNGLMVLNAAGGIGDSANRTLTINGTGDTLFNGFVIQSSTGLGLLSKSGGGVLAMNGSNTTAATLGTTSLGMRIEGGTALFTQGGSGTITLAKVASVTGSAISVGSLNGATAATLDYRVAGGETFGTLTAPGATTSSGGQIVVAAGTTADPLILANQASGALVLSNGIAVGLGGAKAVLLGGSSTATNTIGGVIGNTDTTKGLQKFGAGTWLYAPAPNSYAAAIASLTPSVASGTNTNILTFTSVAGIALGMPVSGTNVSAGSVVTSIDATNNKITISTNISTAVSTALAFGARADLAGPYWVTGGTLQVKQTAATGSGANLFSATNNALVFNDETSLSVQNQYGMAGGTFQLVTPSVASATQTMAALTLTAGAGRI